MDGVAAVFAVGEQAVKMIGMAASSPASWLRNKRDILGTIVAIIPFFDFAKTLRVACQACRHCPAVLDF